MKLKCTFYANTDLAEDVPRRTFSTLFVDRLAACRLYSIASEAEMNPLNLLKLMKMQPTTFHVATGDVNGTTCAICSQTDSHKETRYFLVLVRSPVMGWSAGNFIPELLGTHKDSTEKDDLIPYFEMWRKEWQTSTVNLPKPNTMMEWAWNGYTYL